MSATHNAPIERAAARLTAEELTIFKLISVRLRLQGHSLDLETTADGRLRYLVAYRGWFRHYADLESVATFAYRTEADMASMPIKAPSGRRTA